MDEAQFLVPILIVSAVRIFVGSDLVKLLTTSTKVSDKKISEICPFKYPRYEE